MPKPDPALLNPARYDFSCPVETRFSDLDTNLHVNNVALLDIIQEARARFHTARAFASLANGFSPLIASIAIEYMGEAFYPEPLVVHVSPDHIGRSSYRLAILVTQKERVIAFAQTVLVSMGPDSRPAELQPAYRERLQSTLLKA